MHITDPVEYLYLKLMLRWERSAPPDKHQGLLDGDLERNTQITRMAYVLRKVAIGAEDRVFSELAQRTRRKDGRSYISKDKSWMEEPYPLLRDWYFEGCTSLLQKQNILQSLRQVGMSPAFVACTDDFVAGRSVKSYLPTNEELEPVLIRINKKEQSFKSYLPTDEELKAVLARINENEQSSDA